MHRAALARNGVGMLAGVRYDKIDGEGLHITVGGRQRILAVDNVVICVGQDSLAELMPAEAEKAQGGPRFHR
ncbi:2,4-dienoyl-CoA reductase FadH1 domain protein [Janthinobacterium agaricidamnosum NBRC 102515 = DSM 9628]|uniref:2,4-dienoyl-CoA reductase FadH1 domain protein n=1 Tax=Janthinobacterium agaricidamnosum NBRC 102515 = DSM 9628 TaxID=1349767 RepID=W0VAA7_9BURK|nr:2,4-dienoyl-CoA reductase FadH1 domain protein [Janthinobacterium agaricidamnosum NBRC 102515 = DSM 9628]